MAILVVGLAGNRSAGSESGRRLQTLRAAFERLVGETVAAGGGWELERKQDERIVAFERPEDAAACASDIQDRVRSHNRSHPEATLWVRVGVDAEPGGATDLGSLARRLCRAARAGQALATSRLRARADEGRVGFVAPARPVTVELPPGVTVAEIVGSGDLVRRGGASSRGAPDVLLSRVAPPRPPRPRLDRPELVERVLAGLEGRLVSVVAGAGYGKTTLFVEAMERSRMPWAWLSCDLRLSDARPFLAHLGAAVGRIFPGVGAELQLSGSLTEMVAAVCNEVTATVVDDFVVCIDDAHLLGPGTASATLEHLVSDLPASAHLALLSREALPLALGGRRSGTALLLEERALALSEFESAQLLELQGASLAPESALRLHEQTEGWVTGLLLAVRAGEAAAGPERVGTRPHFDYLADEVFIGLPDRVQGFLVQTAVLERFSAELADMVTGRDDSRSIIDLLRASHLFLIGLDDEGEWFRYHHLFQAFLRLRAEADGPAATRDLHRRAGRAWMRIGHRLEALRHFLEAGDLGRAVEALEPIAEEIASGAYQQDLRTWLATIPVELWAGRPSLFMADATLKLALARHEESFVAFERAIEGFAEAADNERAAAVLFRLQAAMVSAGTAPGLRVATAERHLSGLPPHVRMLPAARLMQAASYGYGCRFPEADREIFEALTSPAVAAWPTLATYARIVRAAYIDNQVGRSQQALAALGEAIGELERREAEDRLGFLPMAHALRGYVLTDMARYEQALAEMPRFEAVVERRGLGDNFTRVLEWFRAMALSGLGRWSELEEHGVLGSAAEAVQGSCYAYRSRGPAALLAAHRGEPAAVRSQVASARAEMTAFGPATDRPLVLRTLALAASTVGLDELAEDLAREAIASARSISGWTGAQLRAAILASHLSRRDADRRALISDALTLTAAASPKGSLDEHWAQRERPLSGSLLAEALERRLGPAGEAERLLGVCGGDVMAQAERRLRHGDGAARAALASSMADADELAGETIAAFLADDDPALREAGAQAAARLARRPRPPLEIVTFGNLSIRRAARELPELRPRCRALFAALLCARGPVHREVLFEWFWPRLPPGRALAAFNTTLHALRRGLEPEISRGGGSLIHAHGEGYVVTLGACDRWDAGELLDLARTDAGPSAPEVLIPRLLRAETVTLAPFLPEWPYEPWTFDMRRDVDEARDTLIERLAVALAAAGQERAAAARYRRLLASDPERESWHRALMRTYARLGERPLALRQYHACRAALRERLGIEPSDQTRELYKSLL